MYQALYMWNLSLIPSMKRNRYNYPKFYKWENRSSASIRNLLWAIELGCVPSWATLPSSVWGPEEARGGKRDTFEQKEGFFFPWISKPWVRNQPWVQGLMRHTLKSRGCGCRFGGGQGRGTTGKRPRTRSSKDSGSSLGRRLKRA